MNNVMQSRRRWYSFEEIRRDLVGGRFRRAIRAAGDGGRLRGASKLYRANCGSVCSLIVPRTVPNFNVAPIGAALRFSWEVLPRRCYKICNGRLPFGIHAWARYDFPFLSSLLEARSGIELT